MVNVRKRGKVYQYQFEIAPVDGKRKYMNKSGFLTKAEAQKEGIIAYNKYMQSNYSYNIFYNMVIVYYISKYEI